MLFCTEESVGLPPQLSHRRYLHSPSLPIRGRLHSAIRYQLLVGAAEQMRTCAGECMSVAWLLVMMLPHSAHTVYRAATQIVLSNIHARIPCKDTTCMQGYCARILCACKNTMCMQGYCVHARIQFNKRWNVLHSRDAHTYTHARTGCASAASQKLLQAPPAQSLRHQFS